MRVSLVLAMATTACASRPAPSVGHARFVNVTAVLGDLHVALAGIGRGTIAAVEANARPVAVDGEVRFVRGPGVIEWWRSVAAGLEQGVTIATRPDGDGALVLEMDVGDGVVPDGSETIALRDMHGRTHATYSGLHVLDARGNHVPARMAARGRRIRIEVEDANATYPLVVDPLLAIEESRGDVSVGAIAADVAISGDGSFVVATDSDNGILARRRVGTIWTSTTVPVIGFPYPPSLSEDGSRLALLDRVYVDSGTGWTSEGRLGGPTPTISRDGGRVVTGGSGGTAAGGSVVYSRTGSTWALEAIVAPMMYFTSIGVSGDGTRAVLGGSNAAGAEVWVRAGTGTWTREAVFSAAPARTGVAMSSDGIYVIAGDGIHVRSGTAWSAAPGPPSGYRAALDATGRRALVQAMSDGPAILWQRSGTAWTTIATLTVGAGASVGLSSAGDRAVVGDIWGLVVVYRLGAAGDPCTAASDCTTGFCSDGVCCTSDCGASTTDCRACSTAAGGTAGGTCTALSSSAAPAMICRSALGVCDADERCSPASSECPPDAREPGGTVCRGAAGPCDRDELCDGITSSCAGDSFQPVGTACGGTPTSCTTAGSCSGTSPLCGGGAPLPASTICAPRDTASPCDLDDHCDGVLGVCVPTYAAPSVECGSPSSDVCDAPDHCSGTSADCVPTFLAGSVCRTPAGPCDIAETCNGSAPECPADSFLASGISCRPAAEACDPEEVCDGVAASCPLDVSCERDAAAGTDAGTPAGVDAGAPPPAVPGCGCRAVGCRDPNAFVLGLCGLVGLIVRREGTRCRSHLARWKR